VPDVAGADLYVKLLERWPEEVDRLVLLAGGPLPPQLDDFVRSVPHPRIDKPYDLEDLRSRVRELLALRAPRARLQRPAGSSLQKH
jgi:hypothetical protein